MGANPTTKQPAPAREPAQDNEREAPVVLDREGFQKKLAELEAQRDAAEDRADQLAVQLLKATGADVALFRIPEKPEAVIVDGKDFGPPGRYFARSAISVSKKTELARSVYGGSNAAVGVQFPAHSWLPERFPAESIATMRKRQPELIWDSDGEPFPGPLAALVSKAPEVPERVKGRIVKRRDSEDEGRDSVPRRRVGL